MAVEDITTRDIAIVQVVGLVALLVMEVIVLEGPGMYH